jgi:hypothetical protein
MPAGEGIAGRVQVTTQHAVPAASSSSYQTAGSHSYTTAAAGNIRHCLATGGTDRQRAPLDAMSILTGRVVKFQTGDARFGEERLIKELVLKFNTDAVRTQPSDQ